MGSELRLPIIAMLHYRTTGQMTGMKNEPVMAAAQFFLMPE
jgi:hypothetical protein